MNRILLILATLLFGVGSTMAQQKNNFEPKTRQQAIARSLTDFYANVLKLDDAQKAKVKTICEQFGTETLKLESNSPKKRAAAVEKLVAEREEKVKNLLNADQLKLYNDYKAKIKGPTQR